MASAAYKAWLDAMPIDAVRERIERLELQLADLRVLERVYGARSAGGNGDPWPDTAGTEEAEPGRA